MDGLRSNHHTYPWVSVYLLAILVLLNEVPVIARFLLGNATEVPFIVLFFLFTLRGKISIRKENYRFAACFAILWVLKLSYKVLGVSSTGWGIYINDFSHYFFCFAMLLAVPRMDEKQKRFVFAVIIVTVLFSSIQNMILHERLGARLFHSLSNSTNVNNITSTQFSSAVMLMSGTSLICFLHGKKKKHLWLVLFIVLIWFNLSVAERAINVILTVGMVVMIIIFNRKRKIIVNLLLVLMTVIFVFIILNYGVVIDYISYLIGSDRITMKLNQIKRAFDAGDIVAGGGSLAARYRLYMLSVRTWLSSFTSFLVGIGEHYSSNLRIGNHSQFLDVLGQYGLIGALLLFYTVAWTMKKVFFILPISKGMPIYRQISAVCAIFVIRGILGVVMYGAIAIQMFLFLPLAVTYVLKED